MTSLFASTMETAGRVAVRRKLTTVRQVADIIERFLSGSSLYPQEFNDFYECGLSDPKLDAFRKR